MRCVLALAILAFAVSPAGAQSSAKEILAKVGSVYASPKTYQFRMVTGEGAETRVATAEPDKMRVDVTAGGRKLTIVVDGRYTWLYLPSQSKYIRQSGSMWQSSVQGDTATGAEGSPAQFVRHMNGFFLSRFRQFPRTAKKVRLLRKENLPSGGSQIPCFVLEIDSDPPGTEIVGGSSIYTWWVDQQRFVVLRESHQVRMRNQKTPQRTDIVYQEAELNQAIPPQTFRFAPPSGTREAEPGDERFAAAVLELLTAK